MIMKTKFIKFLNVDKGHSDFVVTMNLSKIVRVVGKKQSNTKQWEVILIDVCDSFVPSLG